MQFRDYLRHKKLAFALKEVRDSKKSLLDIAFDYGFSSHEAFTRAFKRTYGVTPSEYRRNPKPVVLRTKINPFDRYFFGFGEIGMMKSTDDVKVYFVTVCGLLDSIKGKLDDDGGSESNSGSGQVMAYISDPKGRLCDWGFPRSECYGARLPVDYEGEVPPQMLMADIPEAEYLVFEHGPFDYEQENRSVEEKIEEAMATFDFTDTGYCFDLTPGRIIYLYFNPERFCKYIRPVRRL